MVVSVHWMAGLCINGTFYSDIMFATSKAKSTHGNKSCQVLFISDKGFVAVYPMKTGASLKFQSISLPICTHLRLKDQIGTTLRLLEKSSQWANWAELYIGLLREVVRKVMCVSNAPIVLWDYCIQRGVKIHNVTPLLLQPLEPKMISQTSVTLIGFSHITCHNYRTFEETSLEWWTDIIQLTSLPTTFSVTELLVKRKRPPFPLQ